jgi:hypothetical protein
MAQMIDATIVPVPSKETPAKMRRVKAGKTLTGSRTQRKPAEDKDARWTKKHGKSYGYKTT